MIFAVLVWLERFGFDFSGYSDHQGYRKAKGGRWGMWEVRLAKRLFTVWLPSPCKHDPPPPCVTSTEPIEVEDYAVA